jgi:hypothetical protein
MESTTRRVTKTKSKIGYTTLVFVDLSWLNRRTLVKGCSLRDNNHSFLLIVIKV